MVYVNLLCPVCGEKRVMDFGDDYATDPAFVECSAPECQPWRIPCDDCETKLRKGRSFDEFIAIHEAYIHGELAGDEGMIASF